MNSKNLIIIGAGGHGKVIYDMAKRMGYEDIAYLDDNKAIDYTIGVVKDYEKYLKERDFVVAIGNNKSRKEIQNMLKQHDAHIATIIDPSVILSPSAVIGEGSVIMPGAIINAETKIGKGAIINTAASIDHNCIIGDYSHVSVGVHIAGTTKVGADCFIGAGAIIINNINVCDKVTIGAGGVVISNISEQGTYIGVPVHYLK